MNSKIVGIVPARYKSSRFPGKPLVKLLGKPMIIWVLELSSKVLGIENTYAATDDKRIYDLAVAHGFKAVITHEEHQTGTDRLAEVAKKIVADIYINIQGDEPTLDPVSIQEVINLKMNHPDVVVNAMTPLLAREDPSNINIPKVVFNEKFEMVYMSRLPIPGFKNTQNKPERYYKQVCIYAFSRNELLMFGEFGRKSCLESCEDIEILRFLDLGIPVRMIEVKGNTCAVDVREDVLIVENRLKEIYSLK